MKFDLVKSNHSIGECNYHLQFTSAYRRDIFQDEKVRILTKGYINCKARSMGLTIHAMEFGPDHFHLFISECKNYSISEIVRQLKGFTSYMMRKNHWHLFKNKLWGKKFWSSGYFYRSIGSVTSDAIKFYITNAQAKHWIN